MRRRAPAVRQYMTHLPVEFESYQTVADAARAMDAEQIRHIPVMRGARMTGIVSRSDILAARLLHGSSLDTMPLEKICQTEVLTVPPTMTLDEVAEKMLARRVGSVVVMDGGFIVGIFTATDALRFLCDWFGPTGDSGKPTG
jgi:CBS domain-containing protein